MESVAGQSEEESSQSRSKPAPHSPTLFSLFVKFTSDKEKAALAAFLKHGTHVEATALDFLLLASVECMLPSYRFYLLARLNQALSHNIVSTRDSEYVHLIVVMIQNVWRTYRAKRLVQRLLRTRESEASLVGTIALAQSEERD